VKIICDAQRTPEWVTARLGRLTSSSADAMLANGRGGAESVQRRNLRIRLVLERLTGRSGERDYVSRAMQDGIDREVDAVSVYEALTGRLLHTTGFVAHDSLMAGCSPDGYLDDFTGIVEIKSPIPATHWEYLRTGKVPNDYLKQIVHSLWVTGAQWCDWVSFNPDFPLTAQLKVVRVVRDESVIDAYDQQLRAFLAEVDREVSAFQTVTNVGAVLREVVHG
jgi:hypothetical protein